MEGALPGRKHVATHVILNEVKNLWTIKFVFLSPEEP